ncbi:MAG: iron-sulfur cluster repair protein YtfE [Myxococcales bacterium]|nr:iron-sulfur cluster repair protein YtfE [Myxococcales bacterium]
MPFAQRSEAHPLATRTVGELATGLPGATAVFRAHKLDFCCGGQVPLAEAAAAKGIPLELITAELMALEPAPADHPEATAELIPFILDRYHATHRRELPELVRLARRVEAVHRERADCPRGLADFLEGLEQALEGHMQKEEQILFPTMLAGGHPMIGMPVGVMRSEHDDHGRALAVLAKLTKDHTPPLDGCGTWRALYAGTRKLTDDVMAHVSLENNVLFPRFGA